MFLDNINWKRILFLSLTFFAIVFSLRLFIFTLTPFFLALLLSTIIDKPVSLMAKKMPRNIAVMIILSLVISVIFFLSVFIITNIVYELIYLSRYLPQYREQIMESIDELLIVQQEIFDRMPDAISNILQRNLDNIYLRGESILSNIVEGTLNLTLNIPGVIIFTLFSIIASFFLAKDKEKILAYISSKTKISSITQSNILHDIISYIKVQLLIMSNTTILTGITFSLFRFPYAILLALFSGVLDLIPVVGPGGILWPMMIYYIIFNPKNAIIIFILYLVIISARPIIESKILGKNIGVHPLILLFGLYIGLITLGFQGIILAPLSIIIFKALLNAGLTFDFNLSK